MSTLLESQVTLLFPTVVKRTVIAEAEQLNRDLLTAIETIRREDPGTPPLNWSCELYTTIRGRNRLEREPAFADFIRIVAREGAIFARELALDIDNHPLTVQGCWLNVYGRGHSQEPHVHANSVISGAYYVKVPEGAPGLLIHSPFADSLINMRVTQQRPANMQQAEMPAAAGQLTMFRSWTRHSVRPSKVEDERISIAFNLAP